MIVAGIDIGSRGAKSVIMKDNSVISSFIGDTGPESVKTSYMAIEQVLKGTGLKLENLEYVVATGYGRVLVPFAKENISEISCHARGVNWYFPTVRTILDMGGQDCKAIRLDQEGKVTNFIMNDKCAGGTGRFLEMIADVLQIPLSQVGSIALESKNSVPFNTICAVFAKSDAITYLRKGVPKSDILSGLNEAIATRCLNLLKRVSITADFSS
jgi:predicted CoA-substrate-specific enzyme activase